MKHYWYRNAVFYSLDVETFLDSNGDGVGDMQGLIDSLDYLSGLGVSCLWLLPFYPSPNRDNGYDVKDYYGVDARLGDLGDVPRLIDKARSNGIKILVDLVVNHSSIEHPWFQEARKGRDNPYHDFYVWSDEPVPFEEEDLHLKGEEDSIWTLDEQCGRYYLHHFYKEQPNLNISNPDVRAEILKIMGYWLRLGVDGFRVDAAGIMIKPYGKPDATRQELESFFEEMRDFLDGFNPEAILIAEANVPMDEAPVYLRDDRRMHMIFNFFVNQHLFLSLARRCATPLTQALEQLPRLTHDEQWLNFLRHHDELTLSQLDEQEREEVFRAFGPEENMRIWDSGIRRRLDPMFNGDPGLIRFCYSLLFSLPGVPVIRYGDEIGMGDDLSLHGRESVRTPMQWSSGTNAGFSDAAREQLIKPVIDEGPFNFEKVNVLDAQSDPDSLLNFLTRLISVRKQSPEIGTGEMEVVDCGDERVLVLHYHSRHGDIYLLHNFSPDSLTFNYASLSERDQEGKWVHVLGSRKPEHLDGELRIEGFGYHWWRTL